MQLLNEIESLYKRVRNTTIIISALLAIAPLTLIFFFPEYVLLNTLIFVFLLYFVLERSRMLGNWKEAILNLKLIERELLSGELISKDVFQEMITDIFSRMDYVFSFERSYKIENLNFIKDLDEKQYLLNEKNGKSFEEIKLFITVHKNLTMSILEPVFKNRMFWNGRKYFYTLNLQAAILGINKEN